MMPSARKPTNVTTELAKERNREAAERTLTSWIQNCLALIAFGLAYDRIVAALKDTPLEQQTDSGGSAEPYVALGAIALGVFLLVLAIAVRRNAGRESERAGDDAGYESRVAALTALSTGAVILFGLIALFSLFLKVS